jgi:hypothetical protein
MFCAYRSSLWLSIQNSPRSAVAFSEMDTRKPTVSKPPILAVPGLDRIATQGYGS